MSEKKRIIFALLFPLLFLITIWVFYFSFWFLNIDMSKIGIVPLKTKGLIGILLSPFAHGDMEHILSNSISFFVLSVGLFYFYRLIAYKVFFINWLISGLLLWIGGRQFVHIGASGVVYGLAFFMFFSGVFRRTKSLIALSLVVVVLYGGMVWGMLPLQKGVSWEGHLFGAVSGISLAWYFRKKEVDNVSIKDNSPVSVTLENVNTINYEIIDNNTNNKT